MLYDVTKTSLPVSKIAVRAHKATMEKHMSVTLLIDLHPLHFFLVRFVHVIQII
jgi:hypothetical protein